MYYITILLFLQCEPLPGKVEKIVTWRWVETKEQREEFWSKSAEERKLLPKPQREYFVHWVGFSYWHCTWISELQMEVFHPNMLRAYFKKMDMEEPPKYEEEELGRRRKKLTEADPLEEKFYRYGIRPEWLQIHRIIDHRHLRDGTTEYYVKWRDLPYDKASWEHEEQEIPEFKKQIEMYHVSCAED